MWDGIQSAKTSALLCGAVLGDIAYFHFISSYLYTEPLSATKLKKKKIMINLRIMLVFLGIVFRERMLILQEFL